MTSLINVLPFVQIVLSVILIISILLQRSNAGLGEAFGGEGSSFHTTRRGFEKFLFYLTITCAIIFVILSILAILIK